MPRRAMGEQRCATKFLARTAVVTSGVIATAFLVQSLSSSSAQTQARQLPEYTASGDLVLPKNFHEWIYVGSPLTANALNGGEAGPKAPTAKVTDCGHACHLGGAKKD